MKTFHCDWKASRWVRLPETGGEPWTSRHRNPNQDKKRNMAPSKDLLQVGENESTNGRKWYNCHRTNLYISHTTRRWRLNQGDLPFSWKDKGEDATKMQLRQFSIKNWRKTGWNPIKSWDALNYGGTEKSLIADQLDIAAVNKLQTKRGHIK